MAQTAPTELSPASTGMQSPSSGGAEAAEMAPTRCLSPSVTPRRQEHKCGPRGSDALNQFADENSSVTLSRSLLHEVKLNASAQNKVLLIYTQQAMALFVCDREAELRGTLAKVCYTVLRRIRLRTVANWGWRLLQLKDPGSEDCQLERSQGLRGDQSLGCCFLHLRDSLLRQVPASFYGTAPSWWFVPTPAGSMQWKLWLKGCQKNMTRILFPSLQPWFIDCHWFDSRETLGFLAQIQLAEHSLKSIDPLLKHILFRG